MALIDLLGGGCAGQIRVSTESGSWGRFKAYFKYNFEFGNQTKLNHVVYIILILEGKSKQNFLLGEKYMVIIFIM